MLQLIKDFIQFHQDRRVANKQALEYLNYKINWRKPKTYNDHINIAKIDPKAKDLWIYVDKLKVREYVEKTIGKQYLNKLYGVYQSAEEINFDELPKKFVLKTTHGSGYLIICKNKAKLNWRKTKKQLNDWLKINYYELYRELPYNFIKPQIICEKYLKDKENKTPEYKFFCFHGQPKFIQTNTNRFTKNHCQTFFDLKWEKLPFYRRTLPSKDKIPRPTKLSQMSKIAAKLSTNDHFVHARIDLFNIDSKIYFNEITLSAGSGLYQFTPKKYEYLIGKYF